jgi:hypothetical protein
LCRKPARVLARRLPSSLECSRADALRGGRHHARVRSDGIRAPGRGRG